MSHKPRYGERLPVWLVKAGNRLAWAAFVVMSVLMLVDLFDSKASPHIGVFAFLIAPGLVVTGLVATAAGWLLAWRRGVRRHPIFPSMRMPTGVMSFFSVALIGLTGMSGFRGYHYMESVQFCGQACHNCMTPQLTAFQRSAHGHLSCAECHVGQGVEWMVRTKISGIRMAANFLRGSYEKPIHANLDQMRPPEETCGHCHAAQRPREARRLTRTYFRGNEENTPWTIDMLVNVGGADRGAHWHTATNRRIEFIASDADRKVIPWVRMTDEKGKVTIFETRVTNQILAASAVASAHPHSMNCLDCHNRTGHEFESPERAVNASFVAGRLDCSMHGLKANACNALTNSYSSAETADAGIERSLRAACTNSAGDLSATVAEVKRIYHENFFPDMGTDWRVHADNNGHMTSPGCFRCHDGKHASPEGTLIRHDCDLCHTFTAQGKGVKLASITTGGLKFDHPEELGNRPMKDQCSKCHKGVPIL